MNASLDNQNDITSSLAKEIAKAQKEMLDYFKSLVKCRICDKSLEKDWCSGNICKECCKAGKCPMKDTCRAYPEILEEIIKRNGEDVLKNPSKRIRIVE